MNPFVAHKIASTMLGPDGGYGLRPAQRARRRGGAANTGSNNSGGGGRGNATSTVTGRKLSTASSSTVSSLLSSSLASDADDDDESYADAPPSSSAARRAANGRSVVRDRYFRFDVEGMGDVDISGKCAALTTLRSRHGRFALPLRKRRLRLPPSFTCSHRHCITRPPLLSPIRHPPLQRSASPCWLACWRRAGATSGAMRGALASSSSHWDTPQLRPLLQQSLHTHRSSSCS